MRSNIFLYSDINYFLLGVLPDIRGPLRQGASSPPVSPAPAPDTPTPVIRRPGPVGTVRTTQEESTATSAERVSMGTLAPPEDATPVSAQPAPPPPSKCPTRVSLLTPLSPRRDTPVTVPLATAVPTARGAEMGTEGTLLPGSPVRGVTRATNST